MDAELLQSIKEAANEDPRLALLDADDAERLRLAVATRFNLSRDRIWWWEGLPESAVAIPYTGEEGLEKLSTMLPDGEQLLWLFVTDDDPAPWPCITGSSSVLLRLLRELRFFEYFIIDAGMKWIMLDTHDNMLIRLGERLL